MNVPVLLKRRFDIHVWYNLGLHMLNRWVQIFYFVCIQGHPWYQHDNFDCHFSAGQFTSFSIR